VRFATPPDLDGLVALADNNGINIRPTLLRVLTDLYVQKTAHTPDEEQRYAELALWLLASADLPTRAAVASRLAAYPATPRAVVRRLARDVVEVAEPILRLTPCFTEAELLEIVKDCGERHTAIVAARRQAGDGNGCLAADAERVPGKDGDPRGDRAEAPKPAVASAFAAGEGFLWPYHGSAALRGERAYAARRLPADGVGPLEIAALRRRPDDFARMLQELLNIPPKAARHVVEDASGESLIAAAKALSMPTDVLVRILILLNPAIGQSVRRVFDLVASFRALTPEAAQRIVDGWREPAARDRRNGRYQSVTWVEADERPRRGEARRESGRREQNPASSRVQRTT
jgi:hypothetical protein